MGDIFKNFAKWVDEQNQKGANKIVEVGDQVSSPQQILAPAAPPAEAFSATGGGTTATTPIMLAPGSEPRATAAALPNKRSRTVGELRPKPGVVLYSGATVAVAARLMAAARLDAGLVLSADGGTLEGILTDTDVVRKVIGVGLDAESTLVSAVMTRAPTCVSADTLISDALSIMLELHARHLPVVAADSSRRVVGLLDVAKLLFDAMSAADALSGGKQSVAAVLSASEGVRGVAPTMRMMQAATLMSERRSALLVTDDGAADGAVVGIVTPKDLLFKVVAQGRSTETSSVREVMTPSPDVLPGSASVLQALHQLSTGGYRTIAIVDDASRPLGVLDVLALVRIALADDKGAVNGSPSGGAKRSLFGQPSNAAAAAEPSAKPPIKPSSKASGGPLAAAAKPARSRVRDATLCVVGIAAVTAAAVALLRGKGGEGGAGLRAVPQAR